MNSAIILPEETKEDLVSFPKVTNNPRIINDKVLELIGEHSLNYLRDIFTRHDMKLPKEGVPSCYMSRALQWEPDTSSRYHELLNESILKTVKPLPPRVRKGLEAKLKDKCFCSWGYEQLEEIFFTKAQVKALKKKAEAELKKDIGVKLRCAFSNAFQAESDNLNELRQENDRQRYYDQGHRPDPSKVKLKEFLETRQKEMESVAKQILKEAYVAPPAPAVETEEKEVAEENS